jgi:hypothetical protein
MVHNNILIAMLIGSTFIVNASLQSRSTTQIVYTDAYKSLGGCLFAALFLLFLLHVYHLELPQLVLKSLPCPLLVATAFLTKHFLQDLLHVALPWPQHIHL